MIDVLMSAKNAEKYIKSAIESVLSQTCSDFIFYIVDDASTDKTVEIIKTFSDPRIKFFQNMTSRGLTANLIFLLKKGSREYVARQDADDISSPQRFAKQIAYFKNNNCDFLGTDAILINDQGETNGELKFNGQNLKRELFKKNILIHTSVMMKRKVIEDLGGYREKFPYNEDYDLWLRSIRKYSIHILREPLVKFRIYKSSLSYRNMKIQQLNGIKTRIEALKQGTYRFYYVSYLFPIFVSCLLPIAVNKIIHRKIYKYGK